MRYELSITDEQGIESETGGNVVLARGTLALVSYAASNVAAQLSEAGGERFTVGLFEGKALPEAVLIDLAADGETVNTVVKARLSKLRKAAKAAEDGTAAGTESAPTE